MRVGLVQLTSSDDPQANISVVQDFVAEAAKQGADFVLTPEVTNCVSNSRRHQETVLCSESEDPTLAALRTQAAKLGIWLLIGSLGLKSDGDDPRFFNRSFLIAPDGEISARYDKIHMFDVDLSETETYRESDGYQPGKKAVLTKVAGIPLGMTVCYDLRFPYLFRGLAKSGARIMTVPAAFSPETGPAHWEVLLRARAIETGSFILAPAQCGSHAVLKGRPRNTYGHSLAIDPWGNVLADGGVAPGVTMVDLRLEDVDDVRRRLPSLANERDYQKA
ncbi:MAG: carbon-nitrogen hydrolase family protein [Silicimonas sp.]|nr:carbon-nitrogen hydrolase family protein [Silicimonas sp.]